VDAIVHIGEPLPGEQGYPQIDYLTRGTYNLLSAAVEENLRAKEKSPRTVFLSTLDLMTPYDPAFTVSELWRPRPGLEPAVLSKHLGEYVCREFARDRKVRVIVLRMGKVVRSEEAKGFDPLWVEQRDAAQAVSGALDLLLRDNGSGIDTWWRVFHIAADSPRSRFSVARARQVLGYQPRFQW
jgi:nucleoside-diphosphate-sugar epimerase